METMQQAGVEQSREELPKCHVVVLFGLREEAGGLVDRLSQVVTTKCSTYVEHIGTIDDPPIGWRGRSWHRECGWRNRGHYRVAPTPLADLLRLRHGAKPELRRGQIVMGTR